ncbi:chitin deacetylase [Elstera cyanobacteriorum]|uniref:Chitooligosaccharide deacetylase n=1 Tax=Elstera cyanobacteriorum TaxID=2022747 RepID=A0A255XT41_9PROT|nr:allantoinase PuuE [Elstera cyanobacteriorum]OYQ20138.1 allantoinase [Elstera cyanobacteriorum]GFZ81492.1 chitin deacetylase [Elstera cyanobacteriorum]
MSFEAAPYPRDMIGYGAEPPHAQWPNGAKIAVSFVLNYEEGGENCVLHGDKASEAFLSEIIGAQPIPDARHMNMESIYEYGSRAGVWRLLRLFQEFNMPLTVYAVGMALERYPALAEEFVRMGHEVASHGYRWIDYQHIPAEVERADMLRSIDAIRRLTGERPLGWYLGRCSPNTWRLVAEEGGFLYNSDSYADDLPYWDRQFGKPQLIIPYTLDANDMRFATAQGFHTSDQFFAYLRDAFDALYAEGASAPKMMSIGLHCRLVGRPGRVIGLRRFLDHIARHSGVWVTRRVDIARHWMATHPA